MNQEMMLNWNYCNEKKICSVVSIRGQTVMLSGDLMYLWYLLWYICVLLWITLWKTNQSEHPAFSSYQQKWKRMPLCCQSESCFSECEEMDIWQVIAFCIYTMSLLTMYMCTPVFLAQDRELWAFAMWSQQGARATVERTDGPNSPSP